jgi:hypothetical protein
MRFQRTLHARKGVAACHPHHRGKPLAGTREEVAAFLRATHVIERAQPDPWIEARKRLREDPNAALPELTALLP